MPTTLMRSSLAVACSRGAPAPTLQRLQLCTLCLLLMASFATSWPNRIRSGFVCDDLHVTHAGSNVELARGNVSLVLLKDQREVQCYEPGQYYEGRRAACMAITVLRACAGAQLNAAATNYLQVSMKKRGLRYAMHAD